MAGTDPIQKPSKHIVPVDPLLGTTVVGDLEVIAVIGTGGWSRVYQAKQVSTGRDVALKVLHSHLLFDAESAARFEREAESGASLHHPNICEIYDYNRLDSGQPFIVMERLNGESLAGLLRMKEQIPLAEALPLFRECCDGLKAAHDRNIVHRDIKPGNIFITNDPNSNVKLLDFGMAKIIAEGQPDLTLTGKAFGTVHYMSPEQIMGNSVDMRTDIYSLGCVMYEALSGKKVFDGKTAFEVMNQHVRETPKRLRDVSRDTQVSVSSTLEAIIMKCLAKNPNTRYQNIQELIDDLATVTLDEPIVEKHLPAGKAAIYIVAVILACVGLFFAIGPK